MVLRRHIFLFALVASLGIHLTLLEAYVGYSHLHPRLPHPVAKAEPELIVQYDDLGSDTGTGIGSNRSPGDQPLQAREADVDQALLNRAPTGISQLGAPSANPIGPVGDGRGGASAMLNPAPPLPQPTAPVPQPAPPAKPVQATPEPPAHATPSVQVAVANPPPQLPELPPKSEPGEKSASTDTPAPARPEDQPAPKGPEPAPQPPAMIEKPQVATGDGRRAGTPQPAGEPLPQSESDSDPFSKISANLKFRNGKLVERWGRLVKTTRPQVNVAGIIDAWTLNNPTVVLEVHISPTGKVTDVKVAHSSGSNQIDQPTREAVYDWWFEPAKDRHGKPVADVVFFTIEFM